MYPRSVAFGHNGSDGTHVWAWPEQDLIVLFFTQSRGTLAGIELESTIHRLLIKNDVEGYRRDYRATQAAGESFQPYTGLYWDEDVEDAYYVILVEKDKLVMERPGRLRAVAKPTQEKGRFTIGRSLKLEFDNETHPAGAMLMTTTRRTERQVRHEPDERLPAIDDVMTKVATAHGIHRLDNAGVIKRSGTIKMGPLGFEGTIEQWFDHRNSRTEINMGRRSVVVVTNGDEVVSTVRGGAVQRMEGIARQQEVLGHPAIEYGGWERGYANLEILKRIEDKNLLMVRAATPNLPGATLFVDTETGRVTGAHRIQFAPGAGFVGLQIQYRDFRDVGGVTLPFKIETQYANPLLGRIVVTFDEGESGVSASDLFDVSGE